MKKKVRISVLLVPVALLSVGLIYSLTAGDSFSSMLNIINSGLLSRFGWLYSWTTLALMCTCIGLMFSPFGKVKIGGKQAVPKMSTRDVFAITLCSIAGIGLVTWGTAEVMAHYSSPPESLGIAAFSTESANFAMQTVLLHWTFPAYSTYALPALLFAFIFYNMKRPFSVSEYLYPVFGDKLNPTIRGIVDMVCVFTLLCGMAGTIGTTALSLLGGANYLSDGKIQKGIFSIALIIAIVVIAFVISSITGIMKGIKTLSNMNLWFFIGLALFVLITGPTAFILNYGTEGAGNFLRDLFPTMLRTNAVSGDQWSYWWSIFYWAAYMAWAPISAMFIAKVCYGQTIRKVIMITLIGPSIFTGVWMSIFSGTSMFFELQGYGIADAYTKGYEYTAYAVFEHLPLTLLITVLFLFVAAVSVITASDSATDAMAGLVLDEEDTEVFTQEQNDNRKKVRSLIKVFFGLVLGVVTFIIVSFSDISGVKMISTIGAFPAMWIEILVLIGIVRIAMNPGRYDVHKEDYNEDGTYKE